MVVGDTEEDVYIGKCLAHCAAVVSSLLGIISVLILLDGSSYLFSLYFCFIVSSAVLLEASISENIFRASVSGSSSHNSTYTSVVKSSTVLLL